MGIVHAEIELINYVDLVKSKENLLVASDVRKYTQA